MTSRRADFIAADLLAQAEHGEDASAILITTSERLATEVVQERGKAGRIAPATRDHRGFREGVRRYHPR